MKFSIITPTLQRDSLRRCVESVVTQSHQDREHIIAIDSDTLNARLLEGCFYPRQTWVVMGGHTGNYGNQARCKACDVATGDYFVWLDDDNALYHPEALADIAASLESANSPDWAIFPIHRHGRPFFYDPPGMCYVDSANMVVKRTIGRWPDIEAREADGVLAERLKAEYPYVSFPDVKPIITMEVSSNGI